MSVSKISIASYCNRWISICSNFGDIDKQKKVWFREEGPEIGSFDDDFERIDSTLYAWSETEYKEYLNKECKDSIQEFLKRLYEFREDPQTNFILEDEEELHSDPRWLMIVKSAQEAKAALKSYLQEVENDREA